MKVLILWADVQSANLGVRVVAEGTAQLVRCAFGPDVSIDFQDFRGRSTGIRVTIPRIIGLQFGLGRLAKLIRSASVVVDTGAGDSFSDIYGPKAVLAFIACQSAVRRAGVPLAYGPQTIGPFRTPIRLLAARSLKRASLILARDTESHCVAIQMGATMPVLATDVVFALNGSVSAHQDYDVLFNVSGLLWDRNPHVDNEAYRAAVHGMIQALQARGRRVTLLAHVLETDNPDNDAGCVSTLAQ